MVSGAELPREPRGLTWLSLLPQGSAPNWSHSGGTPEENPGQCPAHEVPGQAWSPRRVGSTSPPVLTYTCLSGPKALEQQELPAGDADPILQGQSRMGTQEAAIPGPRWIAL